jgi:hypothetical protein
MYKINQIYFLQSHGIYRYESYGMTLVNHFKIYDNFRSVIVITTKE